MTPDQVIDLLSLIAARDRRTIGKVDAMAWHEDIGDLSFADCREAVARHFRQSSEWLMPKHVRDLVKAIREERITAAPIPAPNTDDPAEYIRQLRSHTRALGDGTVSPAAIEAGPGDYSDANPNVRNIRALFDAEQAAARARKEAERKAAYEATRAYIDAQEILLGLPDLGEALMEQAFDELFGTDQAAAGFPLAADAVGVDDRQKTTIHAAAIAQEGTPA